MLQNPCKTLGFKKNMVYEIPPGGGGKPYPASGLFHATCCFKSWVARGALAHNIKHNCSAACADPERGPTLTTFLIDDGREDPNTTICGSSLARQRNNI